MDYKIIYIEDLDADTRVLTLQKDNFKVEAIKPSNSIDSIINDINQKKPDLIILDYILTEGSDLKYCNAPTIASTLRSLIATDDFIERPIVLMSTQEKIIASYKKDYTSHDLFDYAITKESATKLNPEKFINRCISFIKSYQKIKKSNYDIVSILDTKQEILHSKLFVYLNENNKSLYEYSRFIYEHLIRCSGLLIGEDILSARLGISKDSKDWNNLLESLENYKYKGIFSDSYNRWWMPLIENWWKDKIGANYSLRHYNAEERTKILTKKLNLKLKTVNTSKNNYSTNYWVICKETKLPLDPFDGIELLDEEFKAWQDKDYVSIDGYLSDIEKYSKLVSEIDRKEMRTYK
ncbi:hypothetical protein SAMN02927916_2305 [Flavobacterium anhuiense]|uniref:Response regulator receiver domain-containing protein n=1 Tax=Flavobacterium anhuiense TaxID=459526 RepID=A0ABY0LQ77_9FLAO|nr:hypothetical protein [Flavobacterium anhuiense]SCY49733.1 hypothetical protein SAMN02927916_2305 [Flavobacterium anhuiense]